MRGKSPRQRLTAAERRTQAMGLYLAGVDLGTIARQVGYANASSAHRAVRQAMNESTVREQLARTEAAMDEQRQLALMRYDRLQAAFWGEAVKDKDKRAANIVIKCMQARDRLTGVEQPQKVEHSGEVTTYEIIGVDPRDVV
jgi:transposase-like protein